ncbi:hypothetical protein LCL87_14075 [Rhodococcus hoagii]|nr:hypothetical protein [Prescottella equi]
MAYKASPAPERSSLGRVAWIDIAATVVAAAGAVVLLALPAVVTIVAPTLTLVQRRPWTWAIAAWLIPVVGALCASSAEQSHH